MLVSEISSTAVPKIISIVGMRGLGKTTLAQLAYNDESVERHFDVRIWVCVSDPFDEAKVANAILEYLKGSGGSELQTIVQNIKENFHEKKYLLVLDDVWNKDPNKWKNLKTALMCGLPGSTILVTREVEVAKSMGCMESNLFRPEPLSTDECWSIISNEVVSSGRTVEDLEQWQDIGSQIANKCKGLPLAAKALGGLLRFKVTREEWQSVLDSEIWQLGEEVEIKRDLFAPLWLSYHDLSPAKKQCLSYCALFLKDIEIPKYLLIRMWMAQGFLKEEKTKDMTMVGEDYFRNLVARCFFQDFRKDEDGQILMFKMHDIVHDFLQFISKKEVLLLADSTKDEDTSVRHLFFSPTQGMDKFQQTIFSFKKLRTLALISCDEIDLHSLFKELTYLRSLHLVDCNVKEIPPTIGRLIHLRLLDLRDNKELSELPETVGDLCNLLILDITDCSEQIQLPRGSENLSNLRYVRKRGGMFKLTQGIGRLHALREASFLVDCEATSLEYLENLNNLNYLTIELHRNVEHVGGAKQAQLSKKKHLVSLQLSLKETGNGADKWQLHDEELIEALKPGSDLDRLKIDGYLGVSPNPSWLLSLKHLRKVEFWSWENCNCLPPLGKLPFLTDLVLVDMKVKRVGLEFLGIEISEVDDMLPSVVAFPKLERLQFRAFGDWDEWDVDEGDQITIMPCLTRLSLWHCDKLKALPDHLLRKKTLKTLEIMFSPFLEGRYREYEGVDRHKISHIPNQLI